MSEIHAWEARQAFACNVARGEAGLNLADAALQVVAEDDAIASHSTVPFPVSSWLGRIQDMVDDLALLLRQRDSGSSTSSGSPEAVVALVEDYLYRQQRFCIPDTGRSRLPAAASVPQPGGYEDPRLSYLHEVLVRRVGHPASLAIIYSEVMRRLLRQGAIDFAVSMDIRDFAELPRAVVLPAALSRGLMLTMPHDDDAVAGDGNGGSGGGGLNTCTSESLLELLRLLKRAYWPFEWDTGVDGYKHGGCNSHGGFRAAAKAAMGDDMNAVLQAARQSGSWRLDQGIWTSPRAGDLRRARAACERLVMVAAEEHPQERRDLAVLLLHAGHLTGAAAELDAYMATPAFDDADLFDRALCRQMAELAADVPRAAPGQPGYRPVSIVSVLARESPVQRDDDRRPLTW